MQNPTSKKSVSLIVGGDVVPDRRAGILFCQPNVESVFGKLLQKLRSADLFIINLECSLIPQNPRPIPKDGPTLGADPRCVDGLRDSGINIVNLANNHCLDYGAAGLEFTMTKMRLAGIETIGAGRGLKEASQPLTKEVEGIKIGLYSMAEHEFSIATDEYWGANPLDITVAVRKLRELRKIVGFIIVLLHAGKEHYPYPTPKLQQTCRLLIELGAKVVICQHSHCPSCWEYYDTGLIVYGQGNFVFDREDRRREWYLGYLVELEVSMDGKFDVSIIPYKQFHDDPRIFKLPDDETSSFLLDLQVESKKIKNTEYTKKKWNEFCELEKYPYFSRLYGHGPIQRRLNRYLHITDWFPLNRTKMTVRNVVECETHREVLETLWKMERSRS